MPIPTPGENESDVDFMHRCVSNPTMRNEYPDRNQRIAVCLDQLNASKDI